MAWKNSQYRGPDIMISLIRTTNVLWQQRSIRNGYLISNAQYREQYPGGWPLLPVEADTIYGHLGERELRNLHSQSSRKTSHPYQAPHSKYVSMTSSQTETGWGEGINPSISFKFDIWRSDVWKGKHDLRRDPAMLLWYLANILSKPPHVQTSILAEQTPPDWDRGSEFEWLALGGTKIYNVQESTDGSFWTNSVPTVHNIDFWWDSLG